jgi:magnesium-transporting ATPase (P-type)
MERPKLYKIGLKNLCFSTLMFWRWIMYGFAMSAIVFFIGFVTFNESPSTSSGNYGDLWLEGVFAYGAVVIIANMTIIYGSSSHTVFSVALIGMSVGAFFVLFWLFSFLQLSTLADQFWELLSFPTYWMNLLFFFTVTFPLDAFFHWVVASSREAAEIREKARKHEDRKKFVKGLDPNKLAPLHRHHGYAFSGEAGHAPQIVDQLLMRQTTKLISAQKLMPTLTMAAQKRV